MRATLTHAALSDGGPAVGDVAGSGPAAGSMAVVANFTGFDVILRISGPLSYACGQGPGVHCHVLFLQDQ